MSGLPFDLKERDVTRQVYDFLIHRRWRLIRMNVGKAKLKGRWTAWGESGMPDYLALYYLGDGHAIAWWLEFKREMGGELGRMQELWHARERKDGASVYTVCDFDSFRKFYDAAFDRPGSPVRGQRELITGFKPV